jgi:hypothetical protein
VILSASLLPPVRAGRGSGTGHGRGVFCACSIQIVFQVSLPAQQGGGVLSYRDVAAVRIRQLFTRRDNRSVQLLKNSAFRESCWPSGSRHDSAAIALPKPHGSRGAGFGMCTSLVPRRL